MRQVRCSQLVLLLCAWPTVTLTVGCADTGQDRISIPIGAQGRSSSANFTAIGDIEVELDEARLAFGPLYLCAGATAGELCDTARAEWLDSAVIDTLSDARQDLGELNGVTGPIRSYMYDLALTSQLTRREPVRLEAAEELGASFVARGRAIVDGRVIPFHAAVDVSQSEATEQGVPVIRRATSDPFEHVLSTDDTDVVLRFDPAPWLRGMDFRAVVRDEACAPGRALACTGDVASTCDAGGEVASTEDCAALGQVCIRGEGCVEALQIAAPESDDEPETQPFRALRIGLFTAGRPLFVWNGES